MVQMMVRYCQDVSCVKLGGVSRGRKGTDMYVMESDWSCLFCFGVRGNQLRLGESSDAVEGIYGQEIVGTYLP